MSDHLLRVENLKTYFFTDSGVVRAVDGVSFDVSAGETLAVVGESGSGKSVTALSILRLVAEPPGRTVDGRILFKGRDLLRLSNAEMRAVRGKDISMIFQEPMTSLNPVYSVGEQIIETLILHEHLDRRAARARAVEMLERVGIPGAAERVSQYPHQLSGGMRQRVMIAMALACDPQLLIADEPTTALDVTLQAQILDLMRELKAASGAAIILITHDLGVVAEVCDEVAVMYAGEIVEMASVDEIFARPTHPYTELLLRSIPRVDRDSVGLSTIGGQVPAISAMPSGCRFAQRCPIREPVCTTRDPLLVPLAGAPEHQVRCWLRAPPVEAGHG